MYYYHNVIVRSNPFGGDRSLSFAILFAQLKIMLIIIRCLARGPRGNSLRSAPSPTTTINTLSPFAGLGSQKKPFVLFSVVTLILLWVHTLFCYNLYCSKGPVSGNH